MHPILPRPRTEMPLLWDASLPTMTLSAAEPRTPKPSPACRRGLPPRIGKYFRAKSLGKEIVSTLDKAHIVGRQSQLFQAGKGDFHAPVIPVSVTQSPSLIVCQSPMLDGEREPQP